MPRPSRIAVVHVALLLFAIALVARSAQVQLWQGQRWAARAQHQHYADVELPAPRGDIYDGTGVPLAQNRTLLHLSVAPREVRDRRALVRQLARLRVDREWIERASDTSRAWVEFPGGFMPSDAAPLAAMRGVYSRPYIERAYTSREATRRILGRVDPDGKPLDGLELTLDTLLRGKSGEGVLVRDPRGRGPEAPTDTARRPIQGDAVRLTINQELQEISEQALDSAVATTGADGGDIVILDPHTGEILAMASERADPRSSGSPAVSEPFEPGSTIKPIMAATLLSLRRARPDEVMNVENGSYTLNGRTITDEHKAARLSLNDVIKQSSNIGIVKFSQRLHPSEQYEALRDFGFGTPTGLPYPAEASGRLPTPRRWSAMSPASLAMGYEIGVTPLQLAAAYAAFANGGELLEPALVKSVRAADGTLRYQHVPRVVRRVMSDSVATAVRAMLLDVVEGGTAKDAAAGTYQLAGKTGTSRRTVRGRGYVPGEHYASFVGLFPADRPQLVILVKLDSPRGANYYGGRTAAPVSRLVLRAAVAARNTALDRRALAASESLGRDSSGSGTSTAVRAAPPSEVTAVGGEAASDSELSVSTITLPARAAPRPVARSCQVPDVRGLSLRDAVHLLHQAGLRVELAGFGRAIATLPEAGSIVPTGTLVRLTGSDGP